MVTAPQEKPLKKEEPIEAEIQSELKIRKVGLNASMRWLEKGIADFKVAPVPSIAYGMVYVVIGLFLIWLAYGNPFFLVTLVTSFLLVGPTIAVGLYDMSHRIEQGEKPSFREAMHKLIPALKFNSCSLCSFAIILGLLMVIWTRLAALIVGMFFGNVTYTGEIWSTFLHNEQMLPFLGVYMLAGLLVAAVAFMISVISVPLIMHHRVDVVTAMITSVQAVLKNPLPMLSWAFIIATLIYLGFLFGFIGLAITLPIIGHASWHAYRELISDKNWHNDEE